jgi:hypothetical protein
MFSKLITKDNIDINDILMKNFRKCGNNEYEIKLIIPNWYPQYYNQTTR